MISQVVWHSGTVSHLRIPPPHTAFSVSDYDWHTRKSAAGRMPGTTEDFVLAHASLSDICRCSMFGPRDQSAHETGQYIKIHLTREEKSVNGITVKAMDDESRPPCEPCRTGIFKAVLHELIQKIRMKTHFRGHHHHRGTE